MIVSSSLPKFLPAIGAPPTQARAKHGADETQLPIPYSGSGCISGIPFTRGSLAYLLRNQFYLGEVAFKGESLAGEQPAIVGRTCSMRSKPS